MGERERVEERREEKRGRIEPKIAWWLGFLRWTRTCSVWPPVQKHTPSGINTHRGAGLKIKNDSFWALFIITIDDKRQVINTDKCHRTTGHCQDKYLDCNGRHSMTGPVGHAALKTLRCLEITRKPSDSYIFLALYITNIHVISVCCCWMTFIRKDTLWAPENNKNCHMSSLLSLLSILCLTFLFVWHDSSRFNRWFNVWKCVVCLICLYHIWSRASWSCCA